MTTRIADAGGAAALAAILDAAGLAYALRGASAAPYAGLRIARRGSAPVSLSASLDDGVVRLVASDILREAPTDAVLWRVNELNEALPGPVVYAEPTRAGFAARVGVPVEAGGDAVAWAAGLLAQLAAGIDRNEWLTLEVPPPTRRVGGELEVLLAAADVAPRVEFHEGDRLLVVTATPPRPPAVPRTALLELIQRANRDLALGGLVVSMHDGLPRYRCSVPSRFVEPTPTFAATFARAADAALASL